MLVPWRCGPPFRATAHDHGLIRKLSPSGVFLSGDKGTLSWSRALRGGKNIRQPNPSAGARRL